MNGATRLLREMSSNFRNIFIEKPLSHNLENLDEFLREIKLKNAIVYVGYSMRYNPIIKRLFLYTQKHNWNL